MEKPESRVYSSEERMTVQLPDRKFVCLEYPGVVNSTEKALETLGGTKAVAKAAAELKQKLELRFRPKDMYCKAVGSATSDTYGLLIKVRRRRKLLQEPCHGTQAEDVASEQEPSTSGRRRGRLDDGYDYQVEVLGTVVTLITFPGMCDFQYLPVVKNAAGQDEGILHKLMVSLETKRADYMAQNVPLFIPPQIFSRFETPQYGFMSETASISDHMPANVLGSGRKLRCAFVHEVGFKDPSPAEPFPECAVMGSRFSHTGLREELLALYEERPVWSIGALRYRLRHNHFSRSHTVLYRMLNTVAYSFRSGPWRTFYVRYGYDPRKDPTSKKYQCVDFRSRQAYTMENEIQCKSHLAYMNRQRKKVGKNFDLTRLRQGESTVYSNEPKLTDFEFHPDILPSQRQIFYMACDIYDTDVQALLTRNDGKEPEVCDARNGWCIPHFTDKCRVIMNDHVQRLATQQPGSALNVMPKRKRKKAPQDVLSEGESQDPSCHPDPDHTDL